MMIELQKLTLNNYNRNILFTEIWTIYRIWLPSGASGGALPTEEVDATGPESLAHANVPSKGTLFYKLQNIRKFKKTLRKS